MQQAPVIKVEKEPCSKRKAKPSRSGKSGWQAWKERRQIRDGLEEAKRQRELVLLKVKVESRDPEPKQALQLVLEPGSCSPDPLPEPAELQDQEVQAVPFVRDADTQTPDWRHPSSYIAGLQVREARPHYINGAPLEWAPSPDPRANKNRNRAESLSPSRCFSCSARRGLASFEQCS